MNQKLQEVGEEIVALYALLDKEERSESEQYKVDNFDKERTRLQGNYQALITPLENAPAPTHDMDVNMPPFEPSNYSLEFPFFESKDSDNYIDILGRDDVIEHINKIIHNRLDMAKYWPIIISTSRGMGKTFLLKKFGMQQIKDNLKTDIIGQAITTGRIISFDFAKEPMAIQNDKDIFSFFPRLMIYYLCRMFDETQVDGIYFEYTEFNFVSSHYGKQRKFNEWLVTWRQSNAEYMMKEYIRLTNIAFNTTHDFPPVFLLDEIQELCRPTNIVSIYDGTSQMHTQLSLLLIQLAGKLKPVCICTGTNNGNIISITDKSVILPQVLSLTPLVKESKELWKQLTLYSNQKSSQTPDINMDSDEDLIDTLVYASYQIPRLLFLAHSVWFDLRKQGTTSNPELYIQKFEQEAVNYYGEMIQILNDFSTEDIAHIILACGVHWQVTDEYRNVPGTDIPWATLIQKSLIFPYLDMCFIFPFSLIWRVAKTPWNKKEEIEAKCAELVPNLDVKNLFISYDTLCCWEYYNLRYGYETLFASSLAVKYYLFSISTGESGYFRFTEIYDIPRSVVTAFNIMNKYEVNFSDGISLPTREAFTNVADLGFAVVHNRNIHNAHHDLFLPARTSLGLVKIAVKAKTSFDLSDQTTITKQLVVSPTSLKHAQQSFWLSLGEELRDLVLFDPIVFLDGSGCCNGLALDFVKEVEVKKSKINRQ